MSRHVQHLTAKLGNNLATIVGFSLLKDKLNNIVLAVMSAELPKSEGKLSHPKLILHKIDHVFM